MSAFVLGFLLGLELGLLVCAALLAHALIRFRSDIAPNFGKRDEPPAAEVSR